MVGGGSPIRKEQAESVLSHESHWSYKSHPSHEILSDAQNASPFARSQNFECPT